MPIEAAWRKANEEQTLVANRLEALTEARELALSRARKALRDRLEATMAGLFAEARRERDELEARLADTAGPLLADLLAARIRASALAASRKEAGRGWNAGGVLEQMVSDFR